MQDNAKQPTIGVLIDQDMDSIEKINGNLKGILPKNYADPDLDKPRLGELLDLIGNIGFGGEDDGGEYHSIYDSYDLYKRFKDPKFEYGIALANTCGRMTLRLVNANVLPVNV